YIAHTTSLQLSPYQQHTTHPIPHSFPTRRSSDLRCRKHEEIGQVEASIVARKREVGGAEVIGHCQAPFDCDGKEHTSKLQSRFDLVCRLLLEKKKKKYRKLNLIHLTY